MVVCIVTLRFSIRILHHHQARNDVIALSAVFIKSQVKQLKASLHRSSVGLLYPYGSVPDSSSLYECTDTFTQLLLEGCPG